MLGTLCFFLRLLGENALSQSLGKTSLDVAKYVCCDTPHSIKKTTKEMIASGWLAMCSIANK